MRKIGSDGHTSGEAKPERPRSTASEIVDVPALADEEVHPAFAPVRRRLVGDAGQPAAVPHQQRQLALAVLRQEVLHVHLLDHVLAVRVELGERPAGLAHDLAHRLAGDLRDAAADVERAHAAQHDVVVRPDAGSATAHGNCDQGATHRSPPRFFEGIVADLSTHRHCGRMAIANVSALGDSPNARGLQAWRRRRAASRAESARAPQARYGSRARRCR